MDLYNYFVEMVDDNNKEYLSVYVSNKDEYERVINLVKTKGYDGFSGHDGSYYGYRCYVAICVVRPHTQVICIDTEIEESCDLVVPYDLFKLLFSRSKPTDVSDLI